MSEQSEKKLETIQAEAQSLLEEIRQLRAQTESELRVAEMSRKGADEHASYANQAKINTEEHSKATAVFKGTAEADQNTIAANKQKSDEILAALVRGKADIDADTKLISEYKREVDQARQEIKKAAQSGSAHLQKIDETKESIVCLQKEIEGKATAAAKANNAVLASESTAAESAKKAAALAKQIENEHTASDGILVKLNEILKEATDDQTELADILEQLKKSNTVATEFEARLKKATGEMEALIVRATGLLPGFASASLAHSFNQEKQRFTAPQGRWLKTFVWCIIGLGVVAAPSFINAILGGVFHLPSESWGEISRSMAMRLPIVIPLVWLAIYAGRNYMLSLRLEEDYAYKEAISKAFEGYKREMKDIVDEDPLNPTPLNKLCLNVLNAIAERPGRIYEGKQKDINILNEAQVAAEKIADFSKRQLATK